MTEFKKIATTPWLFKLYLARKLPLAFIVGLKVSRLDDTVATIDLPFRWLNTNPFKSMYFACLTMASELSTGLLILNKISNSGHNISMLVVDMNGQFHKRGLEKIAFTCDEGKLIDEAIARAIKTLEGQEILLHSHGVNSQHEVICSFQYKWSIKVKS